MKHPFASVLIILVTICTAARGTEPNETFATATVLSPGVMTVADGLTPNSPAFPDTILGIRDGFGQIYFADDDGSPLGDGHASGVGGVSTNSGSIDFSITGFPDEDFIGNHAESGQYRVFVDVRDFFGDEIDNFSETRTLAPGVVHDFSFNDFEWIGGDYDVYIDNALALTSDVDFFTFSGLTPGTQFAARTADPTASNVNTLLGWFDSVGGFLESDDNSAGNNLSLINGTVPAEGTLTFAVTGVGDTGFTGDHTEDGNYELRLQVQSVLMGDYNGNGIVDAPDYILWRNGGPLLNEAADPGTVSSADYTEWRARFGKTSGASSMLGATGSASASAAVPEPSSAVVAAIGLAAICLTFRRAAPSRAAMARLETSAPHLGC